MGLFAAVAERKQILKIAYMRIGTDLQAMNHVLLMYFHIADLQLIGL